MIIADSNIGMASTRSLVEHSEKKSDLKIWVGQRPPGEGAGEARPRALDTLSISDEARTRFDSMKERFVYKGGKKEIDMPEGVDIETFIKKLLIEALTGRKIEVMSVTPAAPEEVREARANDGAAGSRGDWGMTYESHEVAASFEATTFSASGTVRTADGAEVAFTLDLSMTRASITRTDTTVRAGNAVDPLVVNYGGEAADLTSVRFEFDLDSDGVSELVPFAGPGSGFLAMDLNGDGKVNNGSELFGPGTGNGFKELAAHDADGNSWIDEADPVFKSLFVWSKDKEGNDSMKTLKELDIGALYLSCADTGFEVRDSGNNQNGQVRRTGLFLSEDLTPGTIQQIDLIV